MNNNLWIIFLFFILSGSFIYSQEMELNEAESDEIQMKIVELAHSTQSIRCNFQQIKHLDFLSNDMISSGELIFAAPDRIRWEYKAPFHYTAVFRDGQIFINDGGKKSNFDLKQNRSFQSLNDLIVKSVKGDLFDETNFSITFYVDSKGYQVHYKPKDESLVSLINEMILTFDKSSLRVIGLKMIESSNDYTQLHFDQQVFNAPVPDSAFDH